MMDLDLVKLRAALAARSQDRTHYEGCVYARDHRDCAVHALLDLVAPIGLPRHIDLRTGIHLGYGVAYQKADATPIFADMRGGWTPAELRAIAYDLELRCPPRPGAYA